MTQIKYNFPSSKRAWAFFHAMEKAGWMVGYPELQTPWSVAIADSQLDAERIHERVGFAAKIDGGTLASQRAA